MSDDTTHLQLSALVFKRGAETVPLDVISLLGKELLENLTLRQLIHLCIACKKRPSAQMLAFALQNSIPSLVGLPMDNPDPGFYLDIAKRYFDPDELTFDDEVFVYRNVHNYDGKNVFFPPRESLANLTEPLPGSAGEYFKSGYSYYIHKLFCSMRTPMLCTKKGRDFIRMVMMRWRGHYGRHNPGDERYSTFIDGVINVLDHGLVLKRRYLLPGTIGRFSRYICDDEHL